MTLSRIIRGLRGRPRPTVLDPDRLTPHQLADLGITEHELRVRTYR
ncbi:MAG TPA: hypothetical protein VIL84_08285 [Devosiaceae bacterium]